MDSNYWDEPDFVLSYIVTALVNGLSMELGVTLMLRGLVVSGTLVSERTYLERLTRTLHEQVGFNGGDVSGEAKAALRDVLDMREMTEFAPEDVFADDDGEMAEETADLSELDAALLDEIGGLPPPVQHLHLQDPMVVVGEPPMSFGEGSGLILRLRLTAVDGWMMGRLMANVPDFPDFGGRGDITH